MAITNTSFLSSTECSEQACRGFAPVRPVRRMLDVSAWLPLDELDEPEDTEPATPVFEDARS